MDKKCMHPEDYQIILRYINKQIKSIMSLNKCGCSLEVLCLTKLFFFPDSIFRKNTNYIFFQWSTKILISAFIHPYLLTHDNVLLLLLHILRFFPHVLTHYWKGSDSRALSAVSEGSFVGYVHPIHPTEQYYIKDIIYWKAHQREHSNTQY